MSGGWSAAGGGFSPGWLTFHSGSTNPSPAASAVGGRVVEELVAHRALARVGAVDVGHVDRARLALRERDVRDADAERDDGDDEEQSPELHGTSAPVNASTDAATRPAAASTSTVRSRPSVSRTSASASTYGSVDRL